MPRLKDPNKFEIALDSMQTRILGGLAAAAGLTVAEYVQFLAAGRVVDELRGGPPPTPPARTASPRKPDPTPPPGEMPGPSANHIPDELVQPWMHKLALGRGNNAFAGVQGSGKKYRARYGAVDLGVQFEDPISAAFARYWFAQGHERADKIARLRLGRGLVTPQMLGLDPEMVPDDINQLVASQAHVEPPPGPFGPSSNQHEVIDAENRAAKDRRRIRAQVEREAEARATAAPTIGVGGVEEPDEP